MRWGFCRLHVLAVAWASLSARISCSLKLSSELDANKTKLFTFGSTVAIYSPIQSKYIQMHKTDSEVKSLNMPMVDMVPVNWRWERFTIVDAGQGRIALHNGVSNCFLKMSDSGMVFSPHKDQNALPSHWESEFFEVIGVGEGMVALWNKHRKRFVNMSPSGDVGRSRERPDKTLQDGWSWEKFYLVTVRPYLEPGTTVALYNTRNRKFLRMNLKGSTYIVDFSPESDGSRPDGWEKEWFRVDDAGNGMIALWSTKYKNYVMMEHEWLRAAGGIDIWERFVAISPPGSMETALWNPFHQSTIDTFTGAPKRGYPGTLQDLPGNNRYTWKVIVKPPS